MKNLGVVCVTNNLGFNLVDISGTWDWLFQVWTSSCSNSRSTGENNPKKRL